MRLFDFSDTDSTLISLSSIAVRLIRRYSFVAKIRLVSITLVVPDV